MRLYLYFIDKMELLNFSVCSDSDNEVDLDPLANKELDEPATSQKPAGKHKKKKKKDDW